jgi:carboxyl-terminal processing protease
MKRIFSVLLILLSVISASAQEYDKTLMRKLQISEIAIHNLYVNKVDENKLVENAIQGMLSQLDPTFYLFEC